MRTSKLSMVILLSAFFLSVVFLAGCGGSDASGQSGQDEAAAGEGEANKGEANKGEANKGEANKGEDRKERQSRAEVKIAIGRVMSVEPDRNVIIVKAAQGGQDSERMVFKLRKERARVQVDGQEAELADAKEGQQVKVEYVTRKDRSRARSVTLFAADDGGEEPAGGDESTG